MRQRLIPIVLTLLVAITACSKAEGAEPMPSVACDNVATELDTAKENLATAKTKAEDASGPDADDAKDDVKAAQQLVDHLEKRAEECAEQEEEPSTTTVVIDDGLNEEELNALVDIAFGRMGFEPDEVLVGDDVVFDDVPEERGDASFSDVTLKTREDVAAFLNGGTPEGLAARERVEAALADFPGELDRALSGEGFVPIQFTVAVQYFGTTYFNGEDVIVAGNPRQTEEDDILWLFISREGVIVTGASIRADCGNPEFNKIIPVRPDTPPAPPIAQPPTPEEPTPPPTSPPTTERGKRAEDSPVVSDPNDPCEPCRPNIPPPDEVIRPPGTTPPPTAPPVVPPSTAPVCGQPHTPPCENTGITPPPTVAPPPAPPDTSSPDETVPSP